MKPLKKAKPLKPLKKWKCKPVYKPAPKSTLLKSRIQLSAKIRRSANLVDIVGRELRAGKIGFTEAGIKLDFISKYHIGDIALDLGMVNE